jgi:threonylcarbamoyladenosine tRNA methylthiotransferase MtaB
LLETSRWRFWPCWFWRSGRHVINTCSVTENADKQFKQVVKKAMKLNEKLLSLQGCYAQLKPEELALLTG